MTFLMIFLALFMVAVASSAFAPARPAFTKSSTNTQLQFGFLKDLGIEKPEWLPDFGGKKEGEEKTPVAVTPEGEEPTDEPPADEPPAEE